MASRPGLARRRRLSTPPLRMARADLDRAKTSTGRSSTASSNSTPSLTTSTTTSFSAGALPSPMVRLAVKQLADALQILIPECETYVALVEKNAIQRLKAKGVSIDRASIALAVRELALVSPSDVHALTLRARRLLRDVFQRGL